MSSSSSSGISSVQQLVFVLSRIERALPGLATTPKTVTSSSSSSRSSGNVRGSNNVRAVSRLGEMAAPGVRAAVIAYGLWSPVCLEIGADA